MCRLREIKTYEKKEKNMKEFLKLLITQIECLKDYDEELIEKNEKRLVELFNNMTLEEQQKTIDIIGNKSSESLYVISYLLNVIKTELIIDAIIKVLENDNNIKVIESFEVIYQLGAFLFSHYVKYNQLEYYRRVNAVFTNNVKRFSLELGIEKNVVPLEERNNGRIAIFARQICGQGHAPTAKIVNLAEYFRRLGYEVLVISCYQGQLQRKSITKWYNPLIENNIFSSTGRFELDYFGLKTQGVNFNYTNGDDLYGEIVDTITLIKYYNPLFILDLGGNNPIASLCCNVTSVVSMGCTNKPAITASKLVARYFRCTEEESRLYDEYQDAHIFEMIHNDEYNAIMGDALDRKMLGIKEDSFVIIVAGNRLDEEVEGEFLQLLRETIKDNDKVVVTFIGDCKKLCETFDAEVKIGKVIFTGSVNNYKDVMKIGNLFLNPPRTGGGTGAYYAVVNDVPVLTLKNCDVAALGKKFCCDSIAEMKKILDIYMNDNEFEKKQKRYCKEACNSKYVENNISSVKAFVKELCDYIKTEGTC